MAAWTKVVVEKLERMKWLRDIQDVKFAVSFSCLDKMGRKREAQG